MRLLEEFWYGNLNPYEQFVDRDGEYFGALRKVAEEKDRMLLELSPEQQKNLEKLWDKKMAVDAIGEKKAFIFGFRLGAQMIMEAVSDT